MRLFLRWVSLFSLLLLNNPSLVADEAGEVFSGLMSYFKTAHEFEAKKLWEEQANDRVHYSATLVEQKDPAKLLQAEIWVEHSKVRVFDPLTQKEKEEEETSVEVKTADWQTEPLKFGKWTRFKPEPQGNSSGLRESNDGSQSYFLRFVGKGTGGEPLDFITYFRIIDPEDDFDGFSEKYEATGDESFLLSALEPLKGQYGKRILRSKWVGGTMPARELLEGSWDCYLSPERKFHRELFAFKLISDVVLGDSLIVERAGQREERATILWVDRKALSDGLRTHFRKYKNNLVFEVLTSKGVIAERGFCWRNRQ